MTKPVCVVWMDDSKVYEEALTRVGARDKLDLHIVNTKEPIPDDLAAKAEIFVSHKHGKMLSRMPKLKWIQAQSAGVEGWLGQPDLRKDVTLTCGRGTHRVSMPENILGAMFHLTKPYMQIALAQRESKWIRHVSAPLAGKTLGILGLGTIGQDLARRAAALEMRIIGTKRTPMPLPNVEKVYGPAETGEVLREADFVVLLMATTAETENFVDAKFLKQMKPTAYLLNFARGALIVDDDLIAAVKNGTIAGAVLDVFREEPLPATHPFWTADPRILVLPHLGGPHPERNRHVAEHFAENARRYVSGEPLNALVDRAKGY